MFEELVHRYEQPLAGFFYRSLGDRQRSEELFQETFLRVYRKAHTYRGEAPFKAWLYTVARNMCRNEYRRPKPPTASLDAGFDGDGETHADRLVNGHAGPDSRAEKKELAERIRQAVESLPLKQREVFILHHYQGLKYEEVAETLGIAEGTVKSRMYHAVRALRQKLKQVRQDHGLEG